MFSENRPAANSILGNSKDRKSRSTHCPDSSHLFALEPLDEVWWPIRHSLGVFALAVSSYTGTRGMAKGRYLHLISSSTRVFLRETGPSKRVRFNLVDLLLAALVIILLVLVVRDLMY